MNQRKWRHHYIPQFYLRRFTSTPDRPKDKKRIWRYDKQSSVTDDRKIEDIAYDKYFYDLPLSVLPSEFAPDIQEPEDVLADAEGHHATILTDILDRVEKRQPWLSTPQDKYNLAVVVAVMHLRTPSYRIVFEEALRTLSPEDLKAYAKMELEGESLPGPMPEGDELIAALARRAHQTQLHNPTSHGGMVEAMAMFLANDFIWVIDENKSTHPLYTSDKPVQFVVRADSPEQAVGHHSASLRTPGTIGLFPLTPKFALLMLERTKHAHEVKEGERGEIPLDMVTFWNEAQVRESEQFIFCNEDRFDTARAYLTENPQYSNPTIARAPQYAELFAAITGDIRRKLNRSE